MKHVFSACLIALAAIQAQGQTKNNEASATTQQDIRLQSVRGRITDAESNAPLSGISIIAILPDGRKLGARSDKSGMFRIKNVPVGRITLKYSGIGYQEATVQEVLITTGKESIADMALTEKVLRVEGVEVSFDRSIDKLNTVNEYADVSARSFNIEDTKKYAGALGDPSRMAQNFAGVVGANDSRNDIVVRGNSPAGMLWQLEGINIPNPNHFGALGTTGGPVSILNNNNLDKSDFITSAFPAQYGDAFAGVFDLRLRSGNSNKHEFLGQVGFNGFELGAEGPLNESGASYIANYRYSTLGVFKDLGINIGTGSGVPNYQDLNFKLNIPTNENTRFTFFGIGGMSDIEFLGNDQDTTELNLYGNENQNTRVKFKMGILGASVEHNPSASTFMKFTLGASGSYQKFNGDSIDVNTRIAYPNGEALFTTQKYSAIGQLRHKIDPQNSIMAGFTVDRQQFSLNNKNIDSVVRTVVDIADGATLSQGYIQWKHRFSDYFSAVAGVHAQHYSLGDAVAVEPRASINYMLNENQSLSLGYGLHSQTQPIYNYFYKSQRPGSEGQLTNIDMGFTRSHHAVLSYDWSFDQDWRLKAEIYYQSLFDIPVSNRKPTFSLVNTGNSFAPLDEDFLVNSGTARNYGVELTLERFFRNGFYMLFTGSLFDSKYKGTDGIERNTAFNSGYVLNLLSGKEWKLGDDVFALSIRLSTTGGRYLTPIDFEASRRSGNAVYDDTRAFTERQTPYFRVDAKIAYRIELGSSTMEFAIDFQNITNHQNVFQQSYNRRTNKVATEYQQGFLPVPLFRWTF
jgi:hypothetical protein